MSASRERKKRAQAINEPVVQQSKKTKKLSEGWVFAICIVLLVAVVFGSMFAYRAVQRNKTVLTAGGHDVSVKEFNYFYNSAVSSVSSYASYFGIDTSVGLADQNVPTSAATYLSLFGMNADALADVETIEGEDEDYYDMTWAQLFAETAKSNAAAVYSIVAEAEKVGYELDQEVLDEIEEEIDELKEYADSYGYSLNTYIELMFGTGCNVRGYRNYLIATHIASYYPGTLTYTEEELSARYDEEPEAFDKATYYKYTVTASSFMETTTDEETGETLDPTDENRAEAKQAAEAMADSFDTEDESVTITADTTRATLTSSVNEEAADWLFDEAEPGDVKLFASEDENTYYVLQLLDKQDYNTYNIMYMYVPADSTDDTEDEEADETELTAEEKIAAIKESLAADGSSENFAALTEEYTDSSSEATEEISRSSLTYFSDDALLWGAFETRTAGDWEVFETSSGTYFVYYLGEGSSLRHNNVTTTLINEWYEEITDAAAEACEYDEAAAMTASVNLILS